MNDKYNREILARMINHRGSCWDVSVDIYDMLNSISNNSFITPNHMITINEMIKYADMGHKKWAITVERFQAIHSLLNSSSPPAYDYDQIIFNLKNGAAKANMLSELWVVDTLRFLYNLKRSSRTGPQEEDTDEQED